MKKLTIVIPSYNEYLLTLKTIQNILQTSSHLSNIEIIVVDDASTENYCDLMTDRKIKYIKNPTNLGVSQSRNIGIYQASNNYVLTIDAHMQFYKSGWDREIIELIDSNKNSILCFTCRDIHSNKLYYAGGLHFIPSHNFDLILTPYLLNNIKSDGQVPCVAGGAYAFNVDWYKYLKGMEGMIGNGVGETFLSIKSYLAGGDCKLIKNIIIGHNFSKKELNINKRNLYYNKMFLAQTILPLEITVLILNLLPQNKDKEEAFKLFQDNLKLMLQYKIQYEDILKISFDKYKNMFLL